MKKKRTPLARPVGRPPAGHSGHRVQDYPQVSVRLPLTAKEEIQALVIVRKQAQWRVILEAIECYLRELSPTERLQVDALVKRKP